MKWVGYAASVEALDLARYQDLIDCSAEDLLHSGVAKG
jgi:hypothetical protein